MYTVPGGGTLWLGNMNAARDTSLLKENRIGVRMSCLGWNATSLRKGWDDWGGATRSEGVWDATVLDVNGILSGHVHMSHLWDRLREVDYLLESGHNVLIYCAHGARRSAFVTACYLKSKCRSQRKPYRNAAVIGYLRLVRRVVVNNLESLSWAWSNWLEHLPSPCYRNTLLPFISKDEDFE